MNRAGPSPPIRWGRSKKALLLDLLPCTLLSLVCSSLVCPSPVVRGRWGGAIFAIAAMRKS
jgi:hypothetical protein